MDGGEVGAQVVSPVFFHKGGLPGAQFHDPQKKRSLPSGFHPAQPNPTGNWNPSSWNWDSVRFAARPVLDKQPPHYSPANQSGLTLELGGSVYSGGSERPSSGVSIAVPAAQDAAAVRPNKRVRSGSPGSGSGGGGGGGYPKCQVDDCVANLSNAKDYHRRHKVCEAHSKTTKALVANQMQRFCQQCSRFHPLSEFDEGKRSCRRRLAGHNRRRRKTQPTDVLPANQDSLSNTNLDIVNILTVLARLQGSNNNNSNNNNGEKSASVAAMPDRDGLIQIISKISSLSGGTQQAAKSQPSGGGGFDLNNVSEETNPDSVEVEEQATVVNQNAPSTLNLLAVLSSAASLAAASNPNPNPNKDSNSQGSSHSSSGKTNNNNKEKTSTNLGLQLFGTSLGDESPPKVCSTTTKYLSSESSNPMEEQSPCASPPIVHKFFPISSPSEHAGGGNKATRMCEDSTSQPFNMFKDPNANAVRNAVYPYPVAYANSSSGSDHSPSTSNSDAQDRTGRIVFKLFGKDPSSFPQNIREQINKWLSSSPTSMESYIRPGCVVLCVYLSMPALAWDQLDENLLERVRWLVDCSDFWKKGRFLIRTNRQLLSHNKDGMIRVSKSWRAWSSPEVTCVFPLAVVGGRKTSLLLRGRNLTVPGTKIYCTHMGKYLSKEVLCSAYPGTIYDDSSVERFDFPGDQPPFSLSRCFIEVENGFKGNSFPVIVASSPICEELRTLEAVFEITSSGDEPESREQVLHFLNELGWLFQMERAFSIARFKHLLIFSVERDWCVITKTLLDMLAKRGATDAEESLNTVQEVHLLNRAVRRKSRKMVEMLLNYTVYNHNDSKDMYLFIPSMAGPNGWTPLHLAASSDASEDIVDALTDDPQQIGLRCWDSVKDESEQTPKMYAAARNNHWYNELVRRKQGDRLNGQVSICVDRALEISQNDHALQLMRHKCGECAAMRVRPQRRTGFIGRPYVLSMLGIAAVCVCVCVFMRALIRVNYGRSFNWEKLDRGFM